MCESENLVKTKNLQSPLTVRSTSGKCFNGAEGGVDLFLFTTAVGLEPGTVSQVWLRIRCSVVEEWTKRLAS